MKALVSILALGMATAAMADVTPVRLPPTRPEAAHRLMAPAPVVAPAKSHAKAKSPAHHPSGKKHRARAHRRRHR